MFITRKHLSRRTVLRGMGASVSLPLLDAMVPAATALAKTAAAPKPRLGFFYFPHGAIMEKWTPATVGRDFAARARSSSRSQPFRNQLTVVSNIGNKPGESRAVHALVPATWLSCVHPKEGLAARDGADGGPDCRPAHRAGHAMAVARNRRLRRGTAWAARASAVTAAAIPARSRSATPSTPLPVESNPRQLFLRLFGQGDTPEERQFLAQPDDQPPGHDFRARAAALSTTLGAQDRATLNDYLESVREIERRVQQRRERATSRSSRCRKCLAPRPRTSTST